MYPLAEVSLKVSVVEAHSRPRNRRWHCLTILLPFEAKTFRPPKMSSYDRVTRTHYCCDASSESTDEATESQWAHMSLAALRRTCAVISALDSGCSSWGRESLATEHRIVPQWGCFVGLESAFGMPAHRRPSVEQRDRRDAGASGHGDKKYCLVLREDVAVIRREQSTGKTVCVQICWTVMQRAHYRRGSQLFGSSAPPRPHGPRRDFSSRRRSGHYCIACRRLRASRAHLEGCSALALVLRDPRPVSCLPQTTCRGCRLPLGHSNGFEGRTGGRRNIRDM